MINRIQNKVYFIFLSILIILFDQLTKYIITNNYKNLLNKDFLLFKIDFVKNYGAAFNIFNGSRIFLSTISIIFSIILSYLILRKNSLSNLEYFSYSFVLVLSIGN